MSLEAIEARNDTALTRFKAALDQYEAGARAVLAAFEALPPDQQQRLERSLRKLFVPPQREQTLRDAVRAALAAEAIELVQFRAGADGRIIAATRERVLRSEVAERLAARE